MKPFRQIRLDARNSGAELCLGEHLPEIREESQKLCAEVAGYFELWRAPVYRYLVASFGPSIPAEDITQDAFLQLHRCLQAGESIGNARAWVFRTAHNLAVNQVKRTQFISLFDDATWEGLRRSYQDPATSAEQKVIQRETFDRLRAAMNSLTLPERQCLHLRTKGLRYREISKILGLSTTTVAETLYRVIEKLADEDYG